MKKSQLLAGAVLFSLAGWSGAAAADQVYTLNPVVVTAQRMETTEIETPATETVVTAKKIEEAGYKNAFDIIESQVGPHQYGLWRWWAGFWIQFGTYGYPRL